jgi:hypothetical protein
MRLRIRLPKGATAYAPTLRNDKTSGDSYFEFDVEDAFAWHRPLRVARNATIPGPGRAELLDV